MSKRDVLSVGMALWFIGYIIVSIIETHRATGCRLPTWPDIAMEIGVLVIFSIACITVYNYFRGDPDD